MVSIIQLKKVNDLASDGWVSVALPIDGDNITFGGPITMVNSSGAVIKVYADGSVIEGKFER